MPRIRLRMPCTGFSYSCGIIFPIRMSKSITAQFCRQIENGSLTADAPRHSCSITKAYPLIKNSRPRSNGRLYLFLYYYISLSQPEEHTSAGYFPIQQHAQKNSQSLCIFFFNSASQKRLFCIVVNRSKKIQLPRGGGIQMAKRPAIHTT